MRPSDEDLLAVVDAFSAAAVGAGNWLNALGQLAELTGSKAGQLIGYGARGQEPFMWVADPEPAWIDHVEEHGGADPNVNPRLGLGLRTPVLRLITDSDVISREQRRRHPLYVDYFDRYDRPFICATNLARDQGRWVGLAVLRTRRQGEITPQQRAIFATLAPHVRAAVYTQTLLENRGAEVLAGALEALSLAVFILDGRGAVRAMTPTAEALVAQGVPLGLKCGRLQAARDDETRRLAEAIRLAVCGTDSLPSPPLRTLLVSRDAELPLVLDVVPLPQRPHGFGYDPRALVVVRGTDRAPEHAKQLLRTAFRLTEAEAEVAMLLADGLLPEAIAASRGVSLGTVRTQIKAMHAKLGVHRRGELIAYLHRLR